MLILQLSSEQLQELILESVQTAISKFDSNLRSNKSETHKELMTIDEAAKFLGLKKPTLYSKVSKGEIPFMKPSKRLYFSKAELLNYLKAGQSEGLDASEFLINKKG